MTQPTPPLGMTACCHAPVGLHRDDCVSRRERQALEKAAAEAEKEMVYVDNRVRFNTAQEIAGRIRALIGEGGGER